MLRAATEIIARRGFEALRIRDVAERAGVAVGTPNYKFQNRRGVLVAALDRANLLQSRALDAAYAAGLELPPREAALAFLWARVRFALEHPGETLLRSHAVYSNPGQDFRDAIARFADRNMERIRVVITRLIEDGTLSLPSPSQQRVFVRHYTFLGFSHAQSVALAAVSGEVLDEAELRLDVACGFEALLRGAADGPTLESEVLTRYEAFLEA